MKHRGSFLLSALLQPCPGVDQQIDVAPVLDPGPGIGFSGLDGTQVLISAADCTLSIVGLIF